MDRRRRARKLAPPPLGWMPFDCPSVESRRRQIANRLNPDSQPNRSLRIPAERWRLRIRGLVQNVGFRASCCRRAQELGLAGWVRNCSDGSVEVQAEGSEQHLTELRVWCESGPLKARVDSIDGSRVATTGADWFEIRPDHFQGKALTR